MDRIIALIIMLIPGVIAALGIKLMRDMAFGVLQSPLPSLFIQFIVGLLAFLLGLGFIAGFILYRDRKKNKVQERFKKRERP